MAMFLMFRKMLNNTGRKVSGAGPFVCLIFIFDMNVLRIYCHIQNHKHTFYRNIPIIG